MADFFIEQTAAELWKRFCLLWSSGPTPGPGGSSGSVAWKEAGCEFFRNELGYPTLKMTRYDDGIQYYRDVTKTVVTLRQLPDYIAENPASRYTVWYCSTVFHNGQHSWNYEENWQYIHKRMRHEWLAMMIDSALETETQYVAEQSQEGAATGHAGTLILRTGLIATPADSAVAGTVLGSDVSRNYQLQLPGTDAQEQVLELPVWTDVVGSGRPILLFEGNEYGLWIHNQYERFGRWWRHTAGRPSLPMSSGSMGSIDGLDRIADALEQMVSTDLVVSLDKGRFQASIRGGSVSEE